MDRSLDVVNLIEYIQNVLYFATVRPGKTLKCTNEAHYFCVDEKLVYENYYSDFGPLNLSCVYKYCNMLNDKFKTFLNHQKIIHYTTTDAKKKSNAAFLIGCYGVLYLNLTPQEALKPLVASGLSLRNFQDAIQGDSCYTISVLDCLNGIKKAKEHRFFNFRDFNCEEYDRLDKIQGGDLNWLVPGKYLAFIGPVEYKYGGVSLYHPPEIYLDYFLENNVMIVIRLNKKFYDEKAFTGMGIKHYDLYFPDGSCPPRHILVKFLQISEDNPDTAIAVHCKAGLGRTGSLIGSYLIKHYRMTAREAIAWMRICRPGSVIGHQQGWLEQLEPWLLKQGNSYRKRMMYNSDKFPHHDYGIYSLLENRARTRKSPTRSVSNSPPTSRSPSPLMRKLTPISIAPPLKMQSSKNKEAQPIPSAATRASSGNSTVKVSEERRPNQLSGSKYCPSESENNPRRIQTNTELPRVLYKRTPGAAGDPRSSQREHRSRRTEPVPPAPSSIAAAEQEHKRRNSVYTVAAIRDAQVALAKNVEDAKNTLIRSSYQQKPKVQKPLRKTLESAITITQATAMSSFVSENMTPCVNTATHYQNAIPARSPPHRSRLGRSPSPPPSRQLSQRSVMTSTHTLPHVSTPKSSAGSQKPSALQEALYKLQTGIKLARERSSGAASVGAGSLGARRDAPPGHSRAFAPSAHSDDRARATQGDLLNSIKFDRRMREATYTKLERPHVTGHTTYSQFLAKCSRPSLAANQNCPIWQHSSQNGQRNSATYKHSWRY